MLREVLQVAWSALVVLFGVTHGLVMVTTLVVFVEGRDLGPTGDWVAMYGVGVWVIASLMFTCWVWDVLDRNREK